MNKNLIPFPVKPASLSDFDRINEALMEDEQREAIRDGLRAAYAAQREREEAYRGDAREVTLDTFAARVEYQERRQQPTQNAEGVYAGDIFYGSWGYEQTNIDFFQVVALKGKHTAVIRKIAGDYIGGFGMQGNVRPCRDEFISEEYTVRTTMCDYYNPPQLRLKHPTAEGHRLERITDDREFGYSSYA